MVKSILGHSQQSKVHHCLLHFTQVRMQKDLNQLLQEDFITANNIHLQFTLDSRSQSNEVTFSSAHRSQSNEATIQSIQVVQPHYPVGQLYQTENITVTGHNTIPFTCYTSSQCTSSLAKWNITKVMVLNKNYIPPGDSKCTKRSSSLDVKGRETAAAERHSRLY